MSEIGITYGISNAQLMKVPGKTVCIHVEISLQAIVIVLVMCVKLYT